MTVDFFYALLIGWGILLIFWITILVFISIRKPPKSKLTKRIVIYSTSFFFIILFIFLILNSRFVF